jgi:hypothetical protein
MEDRMVGLVLLGVLVLSLVGVVYRGVSKDFGLAPLAIFAVALTFAVFFFGEWMEEEE